MANWLTHFVVEIAVVVVSFQIVLESCEELKAEIKRARKFYTGITEKEPTLYRPGHRV